MRIMLGFAVLDACTHTASMVFTSQPLPHCALQSEFTLRIGERHAA